MTYLLPLLIVLALAGEGWAWPSTDGCNECTGDPNGIHSCTTMACNVPPFIISGEAKPQKEVVVEIIPCDQSWLKHLGPDACKVVIVYDTDHTVTVNERPVSCIARMEAAMKAMERYREREDTWVTMFDATSTITWGQVTPAPMRTCCEYPLQIEPPPPPPTLEEKIEALEQETTRKIREMKKAAAEAEEARGRRIVEKAYRTWAYQEWDAVKRECWREP